MHTGAKALALLVGSALALSACATSSDESGDTESSGGTAAATIKLGYAQEFSAYNMVTEDGVTLANGAVLNGLLRGFNYFGPDGKVTADTEFGTYEKTSDKPLTVKYSINPKAVWSDGKPVDCDDMVLTWLANSTATGESGFSTAAPAGYEQMKKPQCKAGDKDVTVVYTEPFADWDAMFNWTSILPAHIVEQQGGLTKSIIDLADKPKDAGLKKAIEFYNKGWQLNPGTLKKEIMPSMGPYTIDSWTAGQSLVLKPNKSWWGTPPKSDTIIYRFIADDAQSQALQNGEINIMKPQPQVDILNQLKNQGDKVRYETGVEYSYEHLDFNFKGVFADKRIRQAFALCVPRGDLINNLIKPLAPEAKIYESRMIYTFQPGYDEFIKGNGHETYDSVNIDKAKSLLKAAGKTKVKVRLGWRKNPSAPNKRRTDTVTLLQSSCSKAGFEITDTGKDSFFEKELPSGQWDVAMFAWSGSPLVTSLPGLYQSKSGGQGGQNNGQYSNKTVDQLMNKLNRELDKDKQTQIMKQVDTLLWTDLATIPLYEFPAITATDTKVENVKPNATQQDITWNVHEWTLKE